MEVRAIQCPKCYDIVYSRYRNDCRSCGCGYCFVDGGFDYLRVGYGKDGYIEEPPFSMVINLPENINHKILYDDWNKRIDKYGIIKNNVNILDLETLMKYYFKDYTPLNKPKERINIVLNLLEIIWNKNPDLRLGQLIRNCVMRDKQLYYIEDNELVEKLIKTYEVPQKK